MRSHAAPRPSRFAADADGGPPARPEFDAAVTPVRLPPFPGPVNPQSASVQPRPDPHADAEQVRVRARQTAEASLEERKSARWSSSCLHFCSICICSVRESLLWEAMATKS